jgi:osmoprotectant transport system permease protein
MNRSFLDLLFTYLSRNWVRVLELTWEHLYISGIALGLTVVFCVPLGIYLTRNERIAPYVIAVANVFQTVPSLALLGFLIFVFGIGNDNAVAALFLYAMLPVLQNTYTGIKNVPVQLTNAARGMGMTEFQIMARVQLPLAMPVIISGIRVASVWIIGTAALAAAIGGGGLGRLIFSGLSSIRNEVILAGALPATMLALIADYGLRWFQNVVGPERRARRIAHREEKLKGKA